MRTYTLLALLVASFTFFTGCKKDDELSKKDLLKRASWLSTANTVSPGIVITPGGPPVTDYYAQLRGCIKDDILIFSSDDKYREEEGATRCNDNDPTIKETGTFTLSSDEKSITFTPAAAGSAPYSFVIQKLDKDNLVGTITFQGQDGLNYTQTITYKHP